MQIGGPSSGPLIPWPRNRNRTVIKHSYLDRYCSCLVMIIRSAYSIPHPLDGSHPTGAPGPVASTGTCTRIAHYIQRAATAPHSPPDMPTLFLVLVQRFCARTGIWCCCFSLLTSSALLSLAPTTSAHRPLHLFLVLVLALAGMPARLQ